MYKRSLDESVVHHVVWASGPLSSREVNDLVQQSSHLVGDVVIGVRL